ncbi:uncharacterized protein METZ01_LOCUS360321, partial [marine metagenome]
SGPTWYITESGNDTTATGASDDPFRSIQAGINFSSNTDSVTVAAGTYVENINFRGRNIKVVGADRETTIINGDSSGSVVTFESGETNDALLSGFTITNGTATNNGGGIYCNNSNPTVSNVIIKYNTAGNSGGGLYINNSTFTVNNAIISSNTASNDGGGIRCQNSALNISFSEITNNSCGSGGGGIGYGYESTSNLVNVSIINNNDNYDAGLFLGESSSVVLNNSLIYGNDIYFYGGINTIQISHSNIESGQNSVVTNDNGTVTWGSGNIDVNPMFVDTANGNYHLLATSQLINAGHPDSTDSDGSRADIGA